MDNQLTKLTALTRTGTRGTSRASSGDSHLDDTLALLIFSSYSTAAPVALYSDGLDAVPVTTTSVKNSGVISNTAIYNQNLALYFGAL